MVKTTINSDIFKIIEKWAPKSFAYDWDNVGLQVGSYNKPVKKIMITLDVLESVVDEAIEKEVDLIVAHHPMLFKPVKQLNLDDWRGKVIRKLIQHDITVYAAHTNLDVAEGGVNDMLADLLEIKEREILVETNQDSLFKIVVYVPETQLDPVLDALSSQGAGHIGNYSHCTFQSEGTGTFKPLDGTTPFIGEKHKLEKVAEFKVETIVQASLVSEVVQVMKAAHPYEEVAYDVIPLQNEGKKYGLGRIGKLSEPVTLDEFVLKAKKSLDVQHVRVIGNLSKKVNRVAILGGSGEKYIYPALLKKADVYVTGDLTFHQAQEAMEMGISIIDAGHYIEKTMKEGTKKYLEEKIRDGFVSDSTIEVIVSQSNTDPFQYR
ncbi:Nif3-like dinuclear metal center hexameric protein [Ornithinibacillus xuwenensis]|uniref:GTP cyclohydrolase 1 type 2 homolog n=1 Tax=Ornithinibacillus xuwenensis TaxID=3144668 RepID=A0ABU9XCG7_9BACI